MNPKLVSIVIPACNEEQNIVACLRSLKNQNYEGAKEIIVVDNKSTDRTSFLAKQEGVRVIFEAEPGVCAARQAGTEIAEGEIVISSDADTTFPVDWLANIVRAFRENPEVVAVGGPFDLKDPPWWGKLIFTDLIFGIVKFLYHFFGRTMLFGSNTAFRKSAWEGYDTTMNQGGDEIVLLKQLRRKGKILFLPDNAVLTSSRRLDKGFLHFLLFYVIDYFYSLLTGKSLVPPRAVRLPEEKARTL